MSCLIEARQLVKRYGNRTAVKGIDLVVNEGEVLAIIGPNGAGKSTTIELVLGLRQPDGGDVHFASRHPKREIGVQLQSTPFFEGLTALENLRIFAAFYGVKLTMQRETELLECCRLSDVAKVQAVKLSGGQKKRLAIALTLVHQPKVIFLDEPTAALDPRARHETRELIRELAAGGIAIVFTSHDMEEVTKLADRLMVISQGVVKGEGSPAVLLNEHGAKNLEELYLKLTEEEC